MGSVFSFCSKSRTQKLDKQDQAIFDCKVCRDKIKSYIKRLVKQEAFKRNQAKTELKNGNREKAKRFLNQSKVFGEQIKVANGQLDMIQDQIIQIEYAQMKKDALEILQQGNAVLKKLNEEVSIEKWEKVSDDLNEVKEQQNEISEFLNMRGIDQEKFDEEINNELEELEKMQNQGNLDVEIDLPSVKKQEKFGVVNKQQEEKIEIEI